MTTPRLDELLTQVRADGRSTADVRKILSVICGLAVRRGVRLSNPISDVTVHKKSDVEKVLLLRVRSPIRRLWR